ncbi:hypothetical protein CEK64_04955 [Xanthomonas sontii]|nr:hypothetical protein CEK64_04955 [Xanthomonas sontii]
MEVVEFHGLHCFLALHCGRDFSPDAGPQTTTAACFLMLALLDAGVQPIQGTAHGIQQTDARSV